MKNAIVISACVILAIITLGSSSRFPESQVFQKIDMRAILLKNASKAGQPQVNHSINVSPEYATQDYEITLALEKREQESFLQGFFAECTNRVVKLGGQITGQGKTSDFSRQDLMFQTSKTTGQIDLFASVINETNLQVIAIVFECRR